jgi:hypothetical protein
MNVTRVNTKLFNGIYRIGFLVELFCAIGLGLFMISIQSFLKLKLRWFETTNSLN